MQPTGILAGKVAIITGASRGIGAAIARTYVQAGARVVLASRKIEGLEAFAAELRAAGGAATAVAAHIGDPQAAAILVGRALEVYGGLNILVNNAGTNPHAGPLLSSTESLWDKTLDVNLRGAFRLIQAAVPYMAARGGKILNIASIGGLTPEPNVGLYSISKAGLIMLTKVLALELAPQQIQVNALAPGFIKTRFSQAIWDNPAVNDAVIAHTPTGRMGTVDDLTGMALYLASPASDFVTGQVIVIDGGMSLSPGV